MPMRRYPYVLVDVFTDQPMQGNQLAVFAKSDGLSDGEMQAIAREMNLSETTFIVQRDPFVERERGIRVRIFTVNEELPFAGHPTLGTAAYISTLSSFPIDRVELELNVGKIPVTFQSRGEGKPAFGEMRQRDPEFGQVHDRAALAQAAGLDGADIRDDVPIQTVSTGFPFAIVPVKTLAALERLHERYSWAAMEKYMKTTDGRFAYFVCTDIGEAAAGGGQTVRARMIFYNGEDPATGSAAGCAAAWMAKHRVAASGERVLIQQGIEMGRRSHLHVRADVAADGKVVNVRVGGQSVIMARGEFALP